jgi:hypothetical protein
MGKTAVAIDLTQSERRELESLASRRKTAQGLAQRARIVLMATEGEENKDISLRVGAAPNMAGKWRRRFAGPASVRPDPHRQRAAQARPSDFADRRARGLAAPRS